MMAYKLKKINKITGKFNAKTLIMIEGESGCEGINKITHLLYSNTVALLTTQGGGHHGRIGIIIKPTFYINLTTTAWTNPSDPGVYPSIQKNVTVSL